MFFTVVWSIWKVRNGTFEYECRAEYSRFGIWSKPELLCGLKGNSASRCIQWRSSKQIWILFDVWKYESHNGIFIAWFSSFFIKFSVGCLLFLFSSGVIAIKCNLLPLSIDPYGVSIKKFFADKKKRQICILSDVFSFWYRFIVVITNEQSMIFIFWTASKKIWTAAIKDICFNVVDKRVRVIVVILWIFDKLGPG